MDIAKFKVKIFERIADCLEKPHSQYYSGYLSGLFDAYSINTGRDFYDLRMEYNQWARIRGRLKF